MTAEWSNTPPTEPGRYWWRRSWQWESIIREIPEDRRIYSHRYAQKVPVEKIGGEWGAKIEAHKS